MRDPEETFGILMADSFRFPEPAKQALPNPDHTYGPVGWSHSKQPYYNKNQAVDFEREAGSGLEYFVAFTFTALLIVPEQPAKP
jgi:hypothetical protein